MIVPVVHNRKYVEYESHFVEPTHTPIATQPREEEPHNGASKRPNIQIKNKQNASQTQVRHACEKCDDLPNWSCVEKTPTIYAEDSLR